MGYVSGNEDEFDDGEAWSKSSSISDSSQDSLPDSRDASQLSPSQDNRCESVKHLDESDDQNFVPSSFKSIEDFKSVDLSIDKGNTSHLDINQDPVSECSKLAEVSNRGKVIINRKMWNVAKERLLASRATRSHWTADKELTEVSIETLRDLKVSYGVLNFIEFRLIEDDELPRRPPDGYITLYPAMFEVGVRVPFQATIQRWVSELGVALAQINSNGYRMIIALMTLWRENYNCEPPIDILRLPLP